MTINDPIEKLRGWVRSTRADGLGPFGTSLEELDGIADALEAETAESKRRINSYGLMNTELNDALSAICNRFGVDTELAAEDSAKNILEALERGWIRLPVDADGVPIRPGDEVHIDPHSPTVYEVEAVGDGVIVLDGMFMRPADECRHVKPDTVEGIIMEAMQHAFSAPYQGGTLDMGDKVDEYSERIRKAVLDED